jgi:hypothetical protein
MIKPSALPGNIYSPGAACARIGQLWRQAKLLGLRKLRLFWCPVVGQNCDRANACPLPRWRAASGTLRESTARNHHTVLSFYDLSDLNPAKLHMTVPTSFRRSNEIPGVLVLHYADLPEIKVRTVQGFKITRPIRAILDLIEAGTVERSFICQAITQAVDHGVITRPEIRSRQMSEPARRIFEEALRRAA